MQTVKTNLELLGVEELCGLAKKYIIRESLGNRRKAYELELISEILEKRAPELFELAIREASDQIAEIGSGIGGLRVTEIRRPPRSDNSEFRQMLRDTGAHPGDTETDDELPAGSEILRYFKIAPENLFVCDVSGDSMTGAGIFNGDRVFADTSRVARSGDIIVAAVDGGIYIKRMKIKNGRVWLHSENPKFSPVPIEDDMEFTILGTVRHVIHEY